MYYVYILQSLKKLDWLYKGSTLDLKRRVSEHNAGKLSYLNEVEMNSLVQSIIAGEFNDFTDFL
jgi:predicted GIY-YIG superfamily endonuclease